MDSDEDITLETVFISSDGRAVTCRVNRLDSGKLKRKKIIKLITFGFVLLAIFVLGLIVIKKFTEGLDTGSDTNMPMLNNDSPNPIPSIIWPSKTTKPAREPIKQTTGTKRTRTTTITTTPTTTTINTTTTLMRSPGFKFEIALSKRFAKNIDHTADPCKDFYQYACGNYKTEYNMNKPDGSDVLKSLTTKNRIQLVKRYKDIDANDETLPKSVRMSKILNDLCTQYNYSTFFDIGREIHFSNLAIRSKRERREITVDLPGFEISKTEWNCMKKLEELMPPAVNWVFAHNLSDFQFAEARRVLKLIKEAFKNRIASLGWLKSSAKEAAINKLNFIRPYVGFDLWQTNGIELDKFYSGLSIDSFMTESQAISAVDLWNMDKSFTQTSLFETFMLSMTEGNAEYFQTKNSVVINAGIMQSTLYFPKIPDVVLFGGIGSIIGHELAHAFDPNGIEFNAEGEKDSTWFPKSALRRFYENQRCLAKKYEDFGIDTDSTGGEIMSDVVGLQVAYDAYFSSKSNENTVIEIPGLEEFSNGQLFFLVFANAWCNSQSFKVQNAEKDKEHPLNRYRVLGALRNFRAFSDAFKCPKHSPMTPKDPICKSW